MEGRSRRSSTVASSTATSALARQQRAQRPCPEEAQRGRQEESREAVPPEEEGGDYSGLHRDLARPIAASDVEAGGLPAPPSMSEPVPRFVTMAPKR